MTPNPNLGWTSFVLKGFVDVWLRQNQPYHPKGQGGDKLIEANILDNSKESRARTNIIKKRNIHEVETYLELTGES